MVSALFVLDQVAKKISDGVREIIIGGMIKMVNCEDCVHFNWDGGNPNYFGSCANCIYSDNCNDWFTPIKEFEVDNSEVIK